MASTLTHGVITASPVQALRGRSLLTTSDWELGDLEALLALATRLEALDAADRRLAFLPGELAYAVFFDNSTRTRSAWAGAAARLGMHPVVVDGTATQVAHGESAAETGAMLGMNAHALGVRHDLYLGEGLRFMVEMKRGIDDYLAATASPRSVPIVNLQCDVDHPTQTLADLLWLREHFGGAVAGKRVTVSWAYASAYAKPLSVPQGLLTLLTRFGADVVLAHPEGYDLMPEVMETARRQAAASGGSFRITHSMDDAFVDADAVYPKSWGPWALMTERADAHRSGHRAARADIEARALARNAEHRDWICDEERMALTADALYLHCLPAGIGEEVAPEVMDHFACAVARQANKKLYVIMALLAGARVPDLEARLEALR